ncbi:hypothetical protein MLD38_018622 [Melastoma candidum]|uniref:Uncharacterized protein n=1 Tax=Melastoma candidum TaxID=119954 RepID=A0ACB9QUF9_9MYRT|nr:hypothetical protein MLD38_018622 [Melastoma candidum]
MAGNNNHHHHQNRLGDDFFSVFGAAAFNVPDMGLQLRPVRISRLLPGLPSRRLLHGRGFELGEDKPLTLTASPSG